MKYVSYQNNMKFVTLSVLFLHKLVTQTDYIYYIKMKLLL